VVETIKAEKKKGSPVFHKMEVLTHVPLPEGHIRCIVLIDYKGMLDDLYKGDIIDLPERRFKSLSFRGMVEPYKGNNYPNKKR
jgi:hypothetical protein